MGETVGYARVSSEGQNLARQRHALEAAGVARLYEDAVSGRSVGDRPKLAAMLDFVCEGDTVVVLSMDRLARSLPDLLGLVDGLTSRGVTVRFLHESLTFSRDSADPMSRLMLSLLGSVAEFERSLIRERQREGIEIARREKKYRGRRPTDPAQIAEARGLVAQGVPLNVAARRTGVSRSVLYRAGVSASASK